MSHSAAFLEREYNARLAIPDHPQVFARWAEQAAATRKLRACLVDLAYGDTRMERLDLFPARADGAPVFVFIHGGYWRSLDKSDFSWIAPPFVAHGVAVALINYGLAPQTPLEDIVRQTLKALAWLYRNGDRLGFDPARIVVGGHSAGAHLTAMALAARFEIFDPALPPDLVKGGLAISGLFELEPLVDAAFVNADLKLDVARARRLSPALMPPATGAPLVTAVGALESSEFQRQNRLIAQRWPSIEVHDVPMPGANHLTVCDELADAEGTLFDATLQLVRRGSGSSTAAAWAALAASTALAGLASLAGPAQAADINAVQTLTQAEFRLLSEDLGAALSYKPLIPAAPLGITGFDLGFAVTGTRLKHEDVLRKAASGDAVSTLPVPTLRFDKGLPLDLDIAVAYANIPNSNLRYLGGELRWAILAGGVTVPAVSLRVSHTQLGGVGQLGFRTTGVDLSVSKGFALFTPYAGVGEVWTTSTPKNIPTLQSERFARSKVFAGLNVNFGVVNLDVEADRTGGTASYGAKVGFRF